MRSIIDSIYKDGLCLGCGLCEGLCGKENVEMKLDSSGFFRPVVKEVVEDKEAIIKDVCPGINIVNDLKFDKHHRVWGKIEGLYKGYSRDNEIRIKGSSGGIVSAIGIYMLENRLVDAVLQVGGDSTDYKRNSLLISKSKDDVLQCASSRYAPALVFHKILEILKSGEETFCFIGKPCDISALKNFLRKYNEYEHRFKLTVSIMCAGMPSFAGTRAIIEEFTAVEPVKDLVYRGNGWPGYFSFTDSKGSSFQKTYNDSWGKVLNRHLNFRCKICPDGIGLQADIAVGDAWETSDGYPDFSEREGQSVIIARTQFGQSVLQQGVQTGEIFLERLQEEKLAIMQPYQLNRRKYVGARILAYCLAKGRLINFRNLKLVRNSFSALSVWFVREFWRTFKRAINL